MPKLLNIALFVIGAILAIWCLSVAGWFYSDVTLRTPIFMPLALALLAITYAVGCGMRLLGKHWPDKAISPFIFGAIILSGLWLVGSVVGLVMFDRGFATVPFLLSLVAAVISAVQGKTDTVVGAVKVEKVLPLPPPIPRDQKEKPING